MNARVSSFGFFPARRGQFSIAALILTMLAALGLSACKSSSNPGLTNQACSQNSDCTAPYICALGNCRSVCTTSSDCGNGGSCITDGMNAVCQSAAEKQTPCDKQADCTAPLACASDYRCRNLCSSDADCNVLGISGRVCAKDANGVEYCADPAETHDGTIIAPPPAGAPDSPVQEPMQSMGGGGGQAAGGSGDQAGAAGESDVSSGGRGGNSASGGGGSGGAASGCDPACGYGMVCVDNGCVACGASGQPCCASAVCGTDLSCNASGGCECGKPNEACCSGTSCQNGISCQTPTGGTPTCACGLQGAACCPAVGSAAPTCASADLGCAGIKCSCVESVVAGYSVQFVERFDGTFWESFNGAPYAQIQWPSGTPAETAVAASGAFSGTIDDTQEVACGILGGAVWCFPISYPIGTPTSSAFLGAGLGPTDMTSSPVQVVTSTGVSPTPLTGAIQIAGAPSGGQNPTFCAVTSDGSIWCWGSNPHGQLGHGDTADASYARQVWSSANKPFTKAVEVSVGYNSACALKMDGTVWCWGDNSYGELGSGSNTPMQSPFPFQILLPGSAAHLITRPWQTQCAIMQDTSVVCWGANAQSQAGASGGIPAAAPTRVLVAAGGAPLTGVLAVAPDNGGNATCASTTGSGLVCWGYATHTAGGGYSMSPYPAVVYDQNTALPLLGEGTTLSGDEMGSLVHLNPDGFVVVVGGGLGQPCN